MNYSNHYCKMNHKDVIFIGKYVHDKNLQLRCISSDIYEYVTEKNVYHIHYHDSKKLVAGLEIDKVIIYNYFNESSWYWYEKVNKKYPKTMCHFLYPTIDKNTKTTILKSILK